MKKITWSPYLFIFKITKYLMSVCSKNIIKLHLNKVTIRFFEDNKIIFIFSYHRVTTRLLVFKGNHTLF